MKCYFEAVVSNFPGTNSYCQFIALVSNRCEWPTILTLDTCTRFLFVNKIDAAYVHMKATFSYYRNKASVTS